MREIYSGDAMRGRELKASPTPPVPRAPMSAPPASQEQYTAPPPQVLPPAPLRQEPPRKSNIMSLLNDEASEPRPPPPKRVSEVTTTTTQPSQTPPPHHALQPSRYSAHSSQAISQPPSQMSQQIPSQLPSQHQPSQSQLSHAQPAGHALHQHSSSLGPSRSYTPNSFYGASAPPSSAMQQQQAMYSQPPRQTMASQPPPRREAYLGDLHSTSVGYARTSAPSQPSTSLKASPYTGQPAAPPQTSRQQIVSPLDHASSSERDFYARPPQFHLQQQSNAAGSPQVGTTYHSQSQQQPSHRQIAFGGPPHTASPPTQYASQHQVHRSRHNSFDGGRYPVTTTTAPTPQQQPYAHAPQHQGAPLSMQYQQSQHGIQERFESSYERDRRMLEGERRMQEERERRILEERRLQEEAHYPRR
jgi:hypothetical protein